MAIICKYCLKKLDSALDLQTGKHICFGTRANWNSKMKARTKEQITWKVLMDKK